MFDNEPMTVQSRGRLYTSQRQRRELDISGYGHGTPLEVRMVDVDRSPEWGTYRQSASFSAELGTYGEIRIPRAIRRRLGLAEGDTVRVVAALENIQQLSAETTVDSQSSSV